MFKEYALDLLHRICLFFKPFILTYAHPLPRIIDVFTGKPDTMEHAIVQELLIYTDQLDGRVYKNPFNNGDNVVPAIWIDNQVVPTYGCMAVCRYLGRLWRLYPSCPRNALAADGSLDLLQRLIYAKHDNNNQLVVYMAELEERLERFDDTSTWMEGFDTLSVADVCWAGAIRYLLKKDMFEIDKEMFPKIASWWDDINESTASETSDDDSDNENKGPSDITQND